MRECDYCNQTENLKSIGLSGTVCPDCESKGIHAINERQIEAHNVLNKLKSVDESIQTRDDLFNAPTPAIMDILAAVDADASIDNKAFAKAKLIKELILKRQQVIFEHNQIIKAEVSSQKEEQSYFNRLANTLHEREQSELGVVDINYRPAPPKVPKVKIPKAPKSKFDKALLREVAAIINAENPGFSAEPILQMMVVSRGMTLQSASAELRESIRKGKEASANTTG